jgi:elongation factor P
MTISAAIVGDASNYMLENTEAIVAIHDGNPLYIELPASVE